MFRTWAVIAALAWTGGAAADIRYESGSTRTAVLELYTSEGCSSCPPAERWLAQLQQDPRLWREIVPIAFHVDYWDELGWRDNFACPAHSARQRQLAAAGAISTVYTPGFVLNGREWRGWFSGAALPATPEPGGVLSVAYDGDKARIRWLRLPQREEIVAHAALLGAGLETAVVRGENAGRTLQHAFVALATGSATLASVQGAYAGEIDLPASAGSRAPRRALAVWVSSRGSLVPLQATGGWLD